MASSTGSTSTSDTNNNSPSVWWEVEKIVRKRVKKSKDEYLVKWKSSKDGASKKDEWISADKCNCPKAIADFKKSVGELKDEYEVEGIIDSIENPEGKIEYLVKWKGWDVSECSWVPEDDMFCNLLIKNFKKGNEYTHEELREVKKIKESSIHNGVEHYIVVFGGEKKADSAWYAIDMIYMMPNGRKAICKYLNKFC